MPRPTAQDVHQDAALSQVSMAYQNAAYIAEDLFPVITVGKQSDKYYTFTKADWFRDEAEKRAPGTLGPRGDYGVTNTTYFCDEWNYATERPDEVTENADDALDIEQADTEFATDKVKMKVERQLASEIFTAGVWGTDVTGGSSFTYWSTYATSTPIEDVRNGADTIHQNTGMRPNTLVLGRQVWTDLQDHPDFVDRLGNQTTKILRLQTAAALFEVDRILLGDAVYETAAEGGTSSMSFIWGKNALLCYVAPRPGRRVPTAGYTFRWGARRVWKYRDAPEGKRQDVVEVSDFVDWKVTGSDLGYFFTGAVA